MATTHRKVSARVKKKQPITVTFKKVGLKKAEKLFPGSVDQDTKELYASNRQEAGYFKLGILDGKLYGCTYEIAWCGWSVWDPKENRWRDLDDADNDLFCKLCMYGKWEDEDVICVWK